MTEDCIYKRYRGKVLRNLGFAWLAFLVSIGLTILEVNLAYSWVRVTNGLWALSMIATGFFVSRGLYYLWKYHKLSKG